ncbi:MAG: hypothetical protein JWO32_1196, partial [Bacteroidetes bacterium]|nr:hypothetical protein [Bacteroidota bacterium]
MCIVGDSALFCGWIDSTLTIQNQLYSCPDTSKYGILGSINSNGVFSNIKIIKGR